MNRALAFTLHCACFTSNVETIRLLATLGNLKIDPEEMFANGKVSLGAFLKKYFNINHQDEEIVYWQVTYGPMLWEWIHKTSRQLDRMNLGTTIKQKFIILISELIGCEICKRHYIEQIPFLLKHVQHVELFKLFMAFHTFVTDVKNIEEPSKKYNFDYSQDLINTKFLNKYIN